MKGIFRTADFLIIEPCKLKSLHRGDIIAYKTEHINNDPIVHRIIRVDEGHLFTKGDNNRRPDFLPVSQSNLIGKVVAYKRENRIYKVRGRIVGLIHAKVKYFFRRGGYILFYRMKKILPLNKIGDIISFFWKPRIQLIEFSTAAGPVIKWVHRNRTIAAWFPEQNLHKTSFLSRFLIRSKNLN